MLHRSDGTQGDTAVLMAELGRRARAPAKHTAIATAERKHAALIAMAETLLRRQGAILEANAADLTNGEEAGLSPALLDRLKLTPSRIRDMADGIRAIADLRDPVGEVIAEWDRPNGLHIERVRTPLGVVGVIGPWNYPLNNSFGDCIPALAAGNAVVMKPSEVTPLTSLLMAEMLTECGIPEDVFQVATGRG